MNQRASKLVLELVENWFKSRENYPHRLYPKHNKYQQSASASRICVTRKQGLSQNGPNENTQSEKGPSENTRAENCQKSQRVAVGCRGEGVSGLAASGRPGPPPGATLGSSPPDAACAKYIYTRPIFIRTIFTLIIFTRPLSA